MEYRKWLCDLLGCKADCSEEQRALVQCQQSKAECELALTDAKETIRQLELMVPRPAPPKIDYMVEEDTYWVQQHLESLGLNIIRLPLDAKYKFPGTKQEAMKIIAWDWTDQLMYVRDHFDCPDFAMHFMVMTNLFFHIQVCWVLDYKSSHSYNLIVVPGSTDYVLEPQSDALYVWTKRPEQFYYLKGSYVAI